MLYILGNTYLVASGTSRTRYSTEAAINVEAFGIFTPEGRLRKAWPAVDEGCWNTSLPAVKCRRRRSSWHGLTCSAAECKGEDYFLFKTFSDSPLHAASCVLLASQILCCPCHNPTMLMYSMFCCCCALGDIGCYVHKVTSDNQELGQENRAVNMCRCVVLLSNARILFGCWM